MNQVVNNNKTNKVKVKDLPVSCPTKEIVAWSSHPKVYLNLSKTGEACCQYCGTHFILEE